jgi:hypothetical protein
MEGYEGCYQGHVEPFSVYPSEIIGRAFRVPRQKKIPAQSACVLEAGGSQVRTRMAGARRSAASAARLWWSVCVALAD